MLILVSLLVVDATQLGNKRIGNRASAVFNCIAMWNERIRKGGSRNQVNLWKEQLEVFRAFEAAVIKVWNQR